MTAHFTDTRECLICRKHRGEVSVPGGYLYEDDHVIITHALIPEGQSSLYLGYFMVENKRHAPGLADLTDVEAQAVGLAVTRLSRALKEWEDIEHVYSFVLGHHVPHLHIQVIPRYKGSPREYWGVKVTDWPEAPTGGSEEIESFCEKIRTLIKKN